MTATFNWTTVAVALLNLLVGGLLVAIVKSRPALKKIANEREANLLSERAEEMELMRKRIESLEDQSRRTEKQFEAERALYRHQINNLDASFNALLLLLKQGVPVEEAVAAVEKMRNEQLAREAIEKTAIRTAAIRGGEGRVEP